MQKAIAYLVRVRSFKACSTDTTCFSTLRTRLAKTSNKAILSEQNIGQAMARVAGAAPLALHFLEVQNLNFPFRTHT